MPKVESEYHIAKDRGSRAIAGLSMGGSESLLTGLNNFDKFAWIGAFSSGGLPEPFDKDFPGLDGKANPPIRLLWVACGTEDRLITMNRNFRQWLQSKGIQHTDIETPGMHTWMVWRRNLSEFAPLLFRQLFVWPRTSSSRGYAKRNWQHPSEHQRTRSLRLRGDDGPTRTLTVL
jgi:enterochelin esterase family protein